MNYILICPTNLTNNVHFSRRKYFWCVRFFRSIRRDFQRMIAIDGEENTNHMEMTSQKLNSANAPELLAH